MNEYNIGFYVFLTNIFPLLQNLRFLEFIFIKLLYKQTIEEKIAEEETRFLKFYAVCDKKSHTHIYIHTWNNNSSILIIKILSPILGQFKADRFFREERIRGKKKQSPLS